MANSASAKILIVGYGDLGSAIAKQLTHIGMQVYGVARSHKVSIDHAEHNQVVTIQADVTVPASLDALRAIQADIVVYCVAAGGQTDIQYKQAYVDGLRNVLTTQAENPQLKHVFFVSSTRVYGQETDNILDESVLAVPADFGGERLLEAESLLSKLSCGTTVLRLSGIYGPGRLRMINLAKAPERWPQHNSWSNRIHRDDAAAFVTFLIEKILMRNERVQPCYIVTDAKPVSQHEVLTWIATQLALRSPEVMPVSGGKRLSNQEMLATGFALKYPDYQAGYQALLQELAVE